MGKIVMSAMARCTLPDLLTFAQALHEAGPGTKSSHFDGIHKLAFKRLDAPGNDRQVSDKTSMMEQAKLLK